jgi:hypothetical protein
MVVDVPERHLITPGKGCHPRPKSVDDAGSLVSRHARQLVSTEATLLQKEVGPAHATSLHSNANFARAWLRDRPFDEPERLTDPGQLERAHLAPSSALGRLVRGRSKRGLD